MYISIPHNLLFGEERIVHNHKDKDSNSLGNVHNHNDDKTILSCISHSIIVLNKGRLTNILHYHHSQRISTEDYSG